MVTVAGGLTESCISVFGIDIITGYSIHYSTSILWFLELDLMVDDGIMT